jgi:hypothetical protein
VRSPRLPGAGTATLLAGRLAPLRLGRQQQQRHVQRPKRSAVQLPKAAARPGSGGGGKKEPAAAAPPAQAPGSGWRTFWAAVDTSAWLGTVGSAAAFLITQEAILAAAPVVLPLLALYASRQRERLATAADQQAQLARLEGLLLDMQADTADEVAAEVGAEVAELLQLAQKAQQRAGGDPAKLLRAVEAKLSSMEGSVLSTGGRVGGWGGWGWGGVFVYTGDTAGVLGCCSCCSCCCCCCVADTLAPWHVPAASIKPACTPPLPPRAPACRHHHAGRAAAERGAAGPAG